MSNSQNSCLVERLSRYIDLTETESDHIAALEERERSYSRHQEIYTVGEGAETLHVVKSGWLYTYIDMPDGRRQIVKIVHPGDIVGFPDIAFLEATCTLKASEDVVLCPFPKRRLDTIFRDSPRLTALLFTLANRDLATMIDMLRAMGRMSARERISYLLLDLQSRLRLANRTMTTTFRLPLNQSEIGDALGLTHTYVSKTMREMEDEGLIARNGATVTLKREAALKEMVEYRDRYAVLDTTWFPDG